MKGLGEKEYRNILTFIDSLNTTEKNFQEYVLLLFEKFFGFNKSNFWLCDEKLNLYNPVTLNDQKAVEDYLNHFYELDMLTPKNVMQTLPHKRVILNPDLIPSHLLEKSNYYKEFMLKNEFYYNLGMFLYDGNKIWGLVDFTRSKEDKPFNKSDIMSLEFLSRFITQKMHSLQTPSEKNLNYRSINSNKKETLQSSRHPELTLKEQEVLHLAQKGLSNAQIANELFISINTVKKHMQSLYRKYEVTNRTSLCHKVYS